MFRKICRKLYLMFSIYHRAHSAWNAKWFFPNEATFVPLWPAQVGSRECTSLNLSLRRCRPPKWLFYKFWARHKSTESFPHILPHCSKWEQMVSSLFASPAKRLMKNSGRSWFGFFFSPFPCSFVIVTSTESETVPGELYSEHIFGPEIKLPRAENHLNHPTAQWFRHRSLIQKKWSQWNCDIIAVSYSFML